MARYKRAKGRRRFKRTLKAKVNRLARVVRAIKPELKYVLTSATLSAYDDYSSMIDLYPQIVQGLGDSGYRIGDKITMKNINMRFSIQTPIASGDAAVRFIWFIYKNNPDAVVTNFVTIGNMLMNSAFSNSPDAINSPYDYDNFKNFKIIKDRTYHIPTSNSTQLGTPVASQQWHTMRFSVPKAHKTVQYFQAGTTVCKNQLLLLCIPSVDNIQVRYTLQGTYIDT